VEEGKIIVAPVLLPKVMSTLKGFVVSKIPGLDGWTVEFFLEFFDIMGQNIWK
jgi:hypothetical protein